MGTDVNGDAKVAKNHRPSVGDQQNVRRSAAKWRGGGSAQRWARTNPACCAASSLLNHTSAMVRL
jgi:hypothetical protein